MGSNANVFATILTNVGTFFTQMMTWFGDVAETIVSQPILFIFLVGLPVVSAVIGFALRLVRRGKK